MSTALKRLAALSVGAAFVVTACGGGATPAPSSGPSASAAASASAGASAEPSAAGPALPDCLNFADIYAIFGPESDSVDTWSAAAEIASALESTTEFPADLPLSITAPGEESGTFDSFIDITDLEGYAETREAPFNADTDEDGTLDGWTSRAIYVSSSDDNAIIEGIATSAGSWGFVGFAFYEENLDRVRAFDIASEPGGDCIEPTAETIASNEYPISRDLFIYVNKAKLEANPAVVAYVDYYLADGTIDTALETAPYVPLQPDVLGQTQAAWTTFKGTATASPDGEVSVSGSSTVQPISQAVAEAFKGANAGFNFAVEGPGTGDGFEMFCAGQIDIADASRPIDEDEVANCQTAGIEYVELKVAIDGIAVMTQI